MIRAAALAALATFTPPSTSVPIVGASIRQGSILDAAAWARLPHVSQTAVDHDGRTARYEGVRFADVLRDAGVPVGDAVRGASARTYVVVSARDGYAAVFALGEREGTYPRCAPLLAEARDGSPLDAHAGPVQVVAPCDRTHARWVRETDKLTVLVADAPPASGAATP